MKKVNLYTDGGARGNPGPAAAGVVVIEDGELVACKSKYLGETTNNQAEYQALILGLKLLRKDFGDYLTVVAHLDSELVVKQLNGEYKVKNAEILPRYTEVKKLAQEFEKVSFVHIPRAKNHQADALVNECLDKELS